MTEVLIRIIEAMISHFWIITVLIIATSLIKKILYVWLEYKKIQVENKDCIRLSISDSSKILEIQSSNLKIDDLNKIKDEKLLDYNNKAS